jgi:tellurite resistance protein TehA-like permease
MRLSDVFPPASWTIVMATGVVSVDFSADRQPALSAIMLWFAAAVWLLLAVVLVAPLVYERGRFAREASSPVSLTAVAACAVLGTRLAIQDYLAAAAALLALAVIGWALLLVPVLRHWKTPTVGVSFVVGVGTNGLALLSATLAVTYRVGWLVTAAGLLLLLGLAFWCLAMVWLFPLTISEVISPRLTYDVRRWATAFPFGMYAACSFTVGKVTGITGITTFGQVWTWVAFAVTLVVLAGLLHYLHRTWRRPSAQSRHRAVSGPAARC